MTSQWRSRSSTEIDGTGDWARTGLVRGCVTGAISLVVAGVVALAVVMLRPRAVLPPGTTTSSTQTTDHAFAGLVFFALVLMIAVAVGVHVGAAIGLVAGVAAAEIDALTRRTQPPALVGAAVVVAAACTAEAILLVAVPAWTGQWAADGRLVALFVALPFVFAGIGLWFVPVRRADAETIAEGSRPSSGHTTPTAA